MPVLSSNKEQGADFLVESSVFDTSTRKALRLNMRVTSMNRKRASKLRLTLVLMTFPLSYLLTTLPVFVIASLESWSSYFDVKFSTDFQSEFAVAKTLMYANNSFNIFLFILFGKNLRKELTSLLLWRKVKSSSLKMRKNNSRLKASNYEWDFGLTKKCRPSFKL